MTAMITAKGQITIPLPLRQKFHLRPARRRFRTGALATAWHRIREDNNEQKKLLRNEAATAMMSPRIANFPDTSR
jgi:hypothetical protein